ncbi:MAG: hypothetical protein GXP04_02285 [Alphaproteobacteria bacterium]|nr:hypothetical protein [Alphaproteobacteria bacterium]
MPEEFGSKNRLAELAFSSQTVRQIILWASAPVMGVRRYQVRILASVYRNGATRRQCIAIRDILVNRFLLPQDAITELLGSEAIEGIEPFQVSWGQEMGKNQRYRTRSISTELAHASVKKQRREFYKDPVGWALVIGDHTNTDAKVRKSVSLISDDDAVALAQMVLGDCRRFFDFKISLFRVLRTLSDVYDLPEVTLAAIETAPDARSALGVLIGAHMTVFDNGDVVNQAAAGAMPLGAPTVIAIDNLISIDNVAAYCRRFAPETRVYFSNRVKVDAAHADCGISNPQNWRPILEGQIAYFSDGESTLDSDFVSFWNKVASRLDGLFSADGMNAQPLAGLSKYASGLIKFILEDSLYLDYREYLAWQSLVKKEAGERLLILNSRPHLARTLYAELVEHSRAASVVVSKLSGDEKSYDNVNAVDISRLENEHKTNVRAYRNFQRSKLAEHALLNILRVDALPQTIIFTSSQYPNYINFSIDLARRIGFDSCMILDVAPRGPSTLTRERINLYQDIFYRSAPTSLDATKMSAWEIDLSDDIFDSILGVLNDVELRDHPGIRMLIDSGKLQTASRQFVRSLEYMEGLASLAKSVSVSTRKQNNDATTESARGGQVVDLLIRQPTTLIAAPGRTAISYALAEHEIFDRSVDVQFYMTMDTFRYKSLVWSDQFVLDNTEAALSQKRQSGRNTQIHLFGSPSVAVNLREGLEASPQNLPFEVPVTSPQKVLFVGQAVSFDMWEEVLSQLRTSALANPNLSFVVKMHPGNSFGLSKLCRARLGADVERQFEFLRDGNIYDLFWESSLVVGWSSNTLMEAAAVRKGVLIVKDPTTDEYLVNRVVGAATPVGSLADSISRFYAEAPFRREITSIQGSFFEKNPGMDALNDYPSYTERLVEHLNARAPEAAKDRVSR